MLAIAFSAPSALSLHAQPRVASMLRMMADEPLRFEVCQNKYCKKKGSAKTLELMLAAAEGRSDIIVEAADMSHTEHGCFDECTMGPNVRVGGDGPKTDSLPFGAGKIVNGIKGEAGVADLLPAPP